MNRPLILAVFFLLISIGHAGDAMTRLDVFVSTGDNHFLGSSLPIDSPASIENCVIFNFSQLGIKIAPTSACRVNIKNCIIRDCDTGGVQASPGGGRWRCRQHQQEQPEHQPLRI